ncbi:hypothetical protein, partial [Escherichia coli]
MQHNTLPKHDQKLPFTRYDFGWVLLLGSVCTRGD